MDYGSPPSPGDATCDATINPQVIARLAATEAARRGLHVFPLKPQGKNPGLTSWQVRASNNPAFVADHWPRRATGYGIACGPSALYVVDLDVAKRNQPDLGVSHGRDVLAELARRAGEDYPAHTLTVRTGRGGEHLIFRMPDGADLRNSTGRLGPLIDTRGIGGFIVGPGSTVAGRTYRVVQEAAPAPLPSWIHALVTMDKRRDTRADARAVTVSSGVSPREGIRHPERYLARVIATSVDRVASAPVGRRNVTVYGAACVLAGYVADGWLSEGEAVDHLTAAAETAGLTYAEATKTIESGLSAGSARKAA